MYIGINAQQNTWTLSVILVFYKIEQPIPFKRMHPSCSLFLVKFIMVRFFNNLILRIVFCSGKQTFAVFINTHKTFPLKHFQQTILWCPISSEHITEIYLDTWPIILDLLVCKWLLHYDLLDSEEGGHVHIHAAYVPLKIIIFVSP